MHNFDLGSAEYKTSLQQVIAVGGIKVVKEDFAGGWMGRLNYYGHTLNPKLQTPNLSPKP